MATPMQNFIANLTQIVGLVQNQRQIEDRARVQNKQLELQEQGQQLATVLQATNLLGQVTPEGRGPVMQLLERQGMKPEALAALAAALPTDLNTQRARAVERGMGAVPDANVAAATMLGSPMLAPIAEDAIMTNFFGEGIQKTPELLQEMIAQRTTGMNRGQLAMSGAQASLPPTELQAGARINLGTLLSAGGREQARQANQQLGLGYQQLDLSRQRLAADMAQFDLQSQMAQAEMAMQREELIAKKKAGGLSPDDYLKAMSLLTEVNKELSSGGLDEIDRDNYQLTAYRLLKDVLGHSEEEARAKSQYGNPKARPGMSNWNQLHR